MARGIENLNLTRIIISFIIFTLVAIMPTFIKWQENMGVEGDLFGLAYMHQLLIIAVVSAALWLWNVKSTYPGKMLPLVYGALAGPLSIYLFGLYLVERESIIKIELGMPAVVLILLAGLWVKLTGKIQKTAAAK